MSNRIIAPFDVIGRLTGSKSLTGTMYLTIGKRTVVPIASVKGAVESHKKGDALKMRETANIKLLGFIQGPKPESIWDIWPEGQGLNFKISDTVEKGAIVRPELTPEHIKLTCNRIIGDKAYAIEDIWTLNGNVLTSDARMRELPKQPEAQRRKTYDEAGLTAEIERRTDLGLYVRSGNGLRIVSHIQL